MREVRRRKSKNSPVRQSGLKRILCVLALALCAAPAAMADVTFTVDPDLPAPEGPNMTMSGEGIIKDMLRNDQLPESSVIASSFADVQFCYFSGRDVFFEGMIDAFCEHRPVVLSPDVIWLLICQGFAHYVNENPELMRSRLVDHDGVRDLVVEGLPLDANTDWSIVLEQFSDAIALNTKSDIRELIATPFSTTGPDELIAQEITLMETVKSYFRFHYRTAVCGIPYITLTGTPDDWRSILQRSERLREFGLGWWADELKPILQEFVNAASGNENRRFWQDIVKTFRPGDVRGGSGGCGGGSSAATDFDGWFLKLMPFDRNGRTPSQVQKGHDMLSEVVKVGFLYEVSDASGNVVSVTPMEMWAGIVGIEQDSVTMAMTPRIGWLVRESDLEHEILAEAANKRDYYGVSLDLTVLTVPDVLAKIGEFYELGLDFIDSVVIPEWFDSIKVKRFSIKGKMDPDRLEQLHRRFPYATINGRRSVGGLWQEEPGGIAERAGAQGWELPPLSEGTPLGTGAYSYVDLGLSVLWATCNVGAESPEEYGWHLAWAETAPKDSYNNKNLKYVAPDTYRAPDGKDYLYLTKYVSNASGTPADNDYRTRLEAMDDAAAQVWGEGWRMPTLFELIELEELCDGVADTINGIPGMRVISLVPGYEDRSIFLPSAGYADGDGMSSVGTGGYYWSATSVNYGRAYGSGFNFPGMKWREYYDSRYLGYSVRPVHRLTDAEIDSIGLIVYANEDDVIMGDNDSLAMTVGDSRFIVPYIGELDEETCMNPDAFEFMSSDTLVATVSTDGLLRAAGAGTCVIWASTGEVKKAARTVTVSTYNAEAVDLGLSVKWADRNIGAADSLESGGYFTWEEAVLRDSLSGDGWRMPAKEEMYELMTECEWKLVESDSVPDYVQVTGRNGNSICLPLAGSVANKQDSFRSTDEPVFEPEDGLVYQCRTGYYDMDRYDPEDDDPEESGWQESSQEYEQSLWRGDMMLPVRPVRK